MQTRKHKFLLILMIDICRTLLGKATGSAKHLKSMRGIVRELCTFHNLKVLEWHKPSPYCILLHPFKGARVLQTLSELSNWFYQVFRLAPGHWVIQILLIFTTPRLRSPLSSCKHPFKKRLQIEGRKVTNAFMTLFSKKRKA